MIPASAIASCRWVPRVRAVGFTLLLYLASDATSLPGADLSSAPLQRREAALATKNEFKLFVAAANAAHAMKVLKLDEQYAVKQTVCFFDTKDRALDASGLILRAREKSSGPGDSTVKIRATGETLPVSDAERGIAPEQDWTDERRPTFSRSLNRSPLPSGLVSKVLAAQVPASELFDEAQRKCVLARVKGFRWKTLRRYGPVQTEVWRRTSLLHGFPGQVTVELWHLKRAGRQEIVLEVSAKANAKSQAHAQALARQFFGAAKAAGLGTPTGQTKTRLVLDFYNPGR